MAFVNEQSSSMPKPFLSPKTKNLLKSFGLGRWMLGAGLASRRVAQKVRDPIQYKIWMGRLGFPLRNLILAHRPVLVPLGDISVQMVPEGSTACDN
jgi:hypothetical protein